MIINDYRLVHAYKPNCFWNRSLVRREKSLLSIPTVISKWISPVQSGYSILSAVSLCHEVKEVKYRQQEPASQSINRAAAMRMMMMTTTTVRWTQCTPEQGMGHSEWPITHDLSTHFLLWCTHLQRQMLITSNWRQTDSRTDFTDFLSVFNPFLFLVFFHLIYS